MIDFNNASFVKLRPVNDNAFEKMIAPILDDIADEFAGKVTVGKLNVDHNNETPPKYGIRGIPTLLLFKNGDVVGTKVGAMSKAQLSEFINDHI